MSFSKWQKLIAARIVNVALGLRPWAGAAPIELTFVAMNDFIVARAMWRKKWCRGKITSKPARDRNTALVNPS